MTHKSVLHRRHFLTLATAGATLPLVGGFSAAQAQTVSGLFDNLPLEDQVMGNKDAKVSIVEYASMTCPHCKTFHEKIMPEIKKEYIDTGKVKYILRPFPFDGDRRGEAAFMLALCAPNNGYYPMIDALFAIQEAVRSSPNVVQDLLRVSKFAGMSEADFEKCLSNQELLTKIVAGRNKAVREFRVQATPTVFVNNQKLGDSSIAGLKKAIEAAL